MLLIADDDDRVKGVALRYQAVDVALLASIVAARDDVAALRAVLAASSPPLPTAVERERVQRALDRFTAGDAPALVARRRRAQLDPLAFVGEVEGVDAARHYAVRDRLDLATDPHDFLLWLLDARFRADDAPFDLTSSPAFVALHGSARLVVDGLEPFPKSAYGVEGFPHNFHGAAGLDAALLGLHRVEQMRLFDLEEPWRATFFRTGHFGRQLFFLRLDGDDAVAAQIDEWRAAAPWHFVRMMARVDAAARQLVRFLRRARKRGWGVVVADAVDP